jgi:hypothetical protein
MIWKHDFDRKQRVETNPLKMIGVLLGALVLMLAVTGPTSAQDPLRIMPLGDSITTGYTDNSAWTVPFEFGYRSGLYTRLTNAGYDFQFVGSSAEPYNNRFGDPTHGGTTAGGLLGGISGWLTTDDPDIILLKIGTNSQDQTGLNTLVNTITTQKPDAHLIIAEIMPKFSYQQGIVNYNTYIRDTLVPTYQGLGKNVTLVDQYVNFLTDSNDLTSIDQSLFSNGINHPDNDGYDLMAQTWFDGITTVTSVPEPSSLGLFAAALGGFGLLRRRRTNLQVKGAPVYT